MGRSEPTIDSYSDDLVREHGPVEGKSKIETGTHAHRHWKSLPAFSLILHQMGSRFIPTSVPLFPFPTPVQAAEHAQMLLLGTRETGTGVGDDWRCG